MEKEEAKVRATAYLKKEHETILLMLSILEKFCERIQKGEGVRADDVTRLFDGMGTFAYHCHHIKEEAVLFPALEALGLPDHYRSIAEILEAHDQGRAYVEGLRWGIAHYCADPKEGPAALLRRAKRFISFLNQEIEQEDHILFPLADAVLSAEKEAEIVQAFERVEKEYLGDGKAEAFYRHLDELRQVYLHGMERRQTDDRAVS